MGLFDNLKSEDAVSRLNEEALYAEALREIESGLRRDGIWAMAMAQSDMDTAKAAARYIKLRVQSLKDELMLQHQAAMQAEEQEQKRRIAQMEADATKHPNCGGMIVRSDEGNFVSWQCTKCKAKGKFQRGVSYRDIKAG
jgi:hypothetical protein